MVLTFWHPSSSSSSRKNQVVFYVFRLNCNSLLLQLHTGCTLWVSVWVWVCSRLSLLSPFAWLTASACAAAFIQKFSEPLNASTATSSRCLRCRCGYLSLSLSLANVCFMLQTLPATSSSSSNSSCGSRNNCNGRRCGRANLNPACYRNLIDFLCKPLKALRFFSDLTAATAHRQTQPWHTHKRFASVHSWRFVCVCVSTVILHITRIHNTTQHNSTLCEHLNNLKCK